MATTKMTTANRHAKTYDRLAELKDVRCATAGAFENRLKVVTELCQQLGLKPPATINHKHVTDVEIVQGLTSTIHIVSYGRGTQLATHPEAFPKVHAHLSSLPQTKDLWRDYLWLHGLIEGLNFDHASSDIPLLLKGFLVGRKATKDAEEQPIGVGYCCDDRLTRLYWEVRKVADRPTTPKVL